MTTFGLVPLSPLVSMGVGGGLGGRYIDRAMYYPLTPRWGSAYGSTSAPNWDFGHCACLGEMPKLATVLTLIWEA